MEGGTGDRKLRVECCNELHVSTSMSQPHKLDFTESETGSLASPLPSPGICHTVGPWVLNSHMGGLCPGAQSLLH